MAKLKTKTLGTGKNKINVNEDDYNAGFPLNKYLRDKFINKKKSK